MKNWRPACTVEPMKLCDRRSPSSQDQKSISNILKWKLSVNLFFNYHIFIYPNYICISFNHVFIGHSVHIMSYTPKMGVLAKLRPSDTKQTIWPDILTSDLANSSYVCFVDTKISQTVEPTNICTGRPVKRKHQHLQVFVI